MKTTPKANPHEHDVYLVVRSQSLDKLEQLVTEQLDLGAQLYGGIANYYIDAGNQLWFAQSLTLTKSVEQPLPPP